MVLTDEITQHQAELDTLKHDGEQVKQDLAKAVEALNGANGKLDDRRSERTRIEKMVDDLQKQIIAKESEILKTESRIEYINHQAEADRNELQILNTNQTGVSDFVKQSEKKIAEIQSEISKLQVEIAGNQKSLEAKRKERTEVRERIDTLERKYREVDLTVSKLTAELKVMREAEESLTGFTTGSKEFIQAVKGNKVRAKFALLLDY